MPLKLSPRNWQSVFSRNVTAKKFPGSNRYQPLEPVVFFVDTPLCVALLSSRTANYNWWLAARCQAYVYSGAFVNRQLTGLKQWTVGLDRAILLDFKEYNFNTRYALEFVFPKWHRTMNVQAWKYASPMSDATDEDIKLVKEQITRLETKIDQIIAPSQ